MLYPSLIFKMKPPLRQEPIQISSAKMKALSFYLPVCHIHITFSLKNFIHHLTYRQTQKKRNNLVLVHSFQDSKSRCIYFPNPFVCIMENNFSATATQHIFWAFGYILTFLWHWRPFFTPYSTVLLVQSFLVMQNL